MLCAVNAFKERQAVLVNQAMREEGGKDRLSKVDGEHLEVIVDRLGYDIQCQFGFAGAGHAEHSDMKLHQVITIRGPPIFVEPTRQRAHSA